MVFPGREMNGGAERPRDFASLFLDNPETPNIVVDEAVWRVICQNVPQEYTIPDKVFVHVLFERK